MSRILTTPYRYVTADVFTNRMFLGNPVAVLLEADGLSASTDASDRPRIQLHGNHLCPAAAGPGLHRAGAHLHAEPRSAVRRPPNIGTAFVLAREAAARGDVLSQVVFEEAAGLVAITLLHDGAEVSGAELASPEPLSRRTQVSTERTAACLSLAASDVSSAAHAPQVISVGLPFLVAEVTTREALRRARPNRAAFDAVLPLDAATAIYVYTRDGCPDEAGCDLQARMFTPRMTEDPATGSATAPTAALLAELAGGKGLALRVGQGVDIGRPSILLARVSQQDGAHAVTYVGGQCVAVMEGVLAVASDP